MIKDNIIIVGCGKMGGALLAGLKDKIFSPDQIVVMEHDPNVALEVQKRCGVKIAKDISVLPEGFKADVVMFAVKPQVIEDMLPSFKDACNNPALVLSVVAGKSVGFFKKHLGAGTHVVRAMPNLPSQIGHGITVMYADDEITTLQKEKAELFFKAVGDVSWVKDEKMMHAVTAISGSGPAYLFYFAQCLTDAGVSLGLPERLAMELACSTVKGSGILMDRSNKMPLELMQSVMSEKGTTQAAINVLQDQNALRNIIQQAAKSACDRSEELGG